MAQIKINIEEGFIVHWCQEFLDHYGHDSEFPKTVSDIYTLKIAKLMEEREDLASDKEIALFSSQVAVDEIKRVIGICKEAGPVLYKEAFGTAPIGATEKAIDNKMGSGTFKNWLDKFEEGEYTLCQEIIRISH